MSGGHWEYQHWTIEYHLAEEIANDADVRERWPRLARVQLGPVLGQALHDMDWELSGDSYTGRDFEEQTIVAIRESTIV